ncbi:MAG TPA: thiamine pyrophosphate-binding protein [Devosia sp.]|nr:thiamine pyrophosphate-binding protein [Devosia sp.]
MTGTRSGARYIADYLKAREVSHVFFMDAILRRALIEMEAVGITRVLAHSEAGAAYMADGFARVSGRPGVCMAQSVGAANLAAGLQDAYLQRSPVLAITGHKPASHQYRRAYQEIEHGPLYRSVTKFDAAVDTPEQLPLLLEQAFREMTTGAPRPVHLDMLGLQGQVTETAEIPDPVAPDPRYNALPARRPAAEAADIAQAAAMLRVSKRPVLICGAGALHAGASATILALVERHAIPVGTSTGGHNVVPTEHPLHFGVVGNYSSPPANRLLSQADLVIYVGCNVNDQTTMDWTIPAASIAKIQIDIDPSELGRNYPGMHGIAADPREAVTALAGELAENVRFADWAETVRAVMADWRAQVAEAAASGSAPIAVQRLCAEIGKALPDNAILVGDTGFSAIWSANLIPMRAGQTYLRAAGSLGWAFPASLGAQCAAPDRPVVCFTGDGAFYYHIGEIETARRRKLPVVIVVNNNSLFGQALGNVRRLHGNRPGSFAEMISFGPTNFAEIAKSFGIDGIRVEDPAQLAPALKAAIAMRRPVVVDVVTDPESTIPEPWALPA